MISLQLANLLRSRSYVPRYRCAVCDRYYVHAAHSQAFDGGHSSRSKSPNSNPHSLVSFLNPSLSQCYRSCLGSDISPFTSVLESFTPTTMDSYGNTLGITEADYGIIWSCLNVAYGEISKPNPVE